MFQSFTSEVRPTKVNNIKADIATYVREILFLELSLSQNNRDVCGIVVKA